MFISIELADSPSTDHENTEKSMEEMQKSFEDLRDRITRKRQEIQSLRDGVCPHISPTIYLLAYQANVVSASFSRLHL